MNKISIALLVVLVFVLSSICYTGLVLISQLFYGVPTDIYTHIFVCLVVASLMATHSLFLPSQIVNNVLSGKDISHTRQLVGRFVHGIFLAVVLVSAVSGVFMFFTNPGDIPSLFCVGVFIYFVIRLTKRQGLANSATELVVIFPLCLGIDGFFVCLRILDPMFVFGLILCGVAFMPKAADNQTHISSA